MGRPGKASQTVAALSSNVQARLAVASRVRFAPSLSYAVSYALRLGCCALCVWGALGCRKRAETESSPTERAPARIVSASPEPVELGQVARNSFFEMTARSTKTCTVEAHFRPVPGVQKLGVEVEITGVSDLEVPVNPFYAELRDETGQRFESTLAGCAPVLTARRVKRDESQSGWLTFDVPEGARHLQLRYEPIVIGVGRVASIHTLDR